MVGFRDAAYFDDNDNYNSALLPSQRYNEWYMWNKYLDSLLHWVILIPASVRKKVWLPITKTHF